MTIQAPGKIKMRNGKRLHSSNSNENMRQLTDSELLLAIGNDRSKEAFQEFYRRHERRYYNLALRITQNEDLAAEAMQEAMIKIWRSASLYKVEGNAIGWSTRVITNESLMLLRKKWSKKEVAQEDGLTWVTAKDQHPEEVIENNDLHKELRTILHSLPPSEQRLMALYFGSGLTQAEMAKALRIPQSTISLLLKKVLTKLRTDLVRAGFGAATVGAFLDDSNSWQAWLEACQTPALLQDQIFSRIAADLVSLKATGINPTRLQKGLTLGGIIMLGAGVFAWASLYASNNTTVKPAAPIPTPINAQIAKTLFKKVYHFDQPDDWKRDLLVTEGSVTYQKQGGYRDTGCLRTGLETTHIKIDIPLLRFPFKISLRYKKWRRISQEGTVGTGIASYLKPETKRVFFGNFKTPETVDSDAGKLTPPDRWHTTEIIFQESGMETWSDGQLYSVMLRETTLEHQKYLLAINGVLLDELVVEQLQDDHVMDLSKFVAVRNKHTHDNQINRKIPIYDLQQYSSIDEPVLMQFTTPLK